MGSHKNTLKKLLFSFCLPLVSIMICLKNDKIVNFITKCFQLKTSIFKCYESDFCKNSHASPGNIFLNYSKVSFMFQIQVFKKMPKQKCILWCILY